MMKRIKKFWHRWHPSLYACLALGFFEFRIMSMQHAFERDVFEYLHVKWHLFKWNGEFDLFVPGDRQYGGAS